MSKYKSYYLHFNSPLHIGNHRPDSYEQTESFLRSDTIIAAIYATWAKIGHADWIPSSGIPPFVLSSAFPFFEKAVNEKIHFFPRLKVSPKRDTTATYDTVLVKALKKVQWLDQDYFEKLLRLESSQSFGKNDEHIQEVFLSRVKLPVKGLMSKEVMERVTIPRNRENGENAVPFYMERIRFNQGGLYFLAQGEELDRLEKALDLLQYEGFGTDRNIGNGFFEWSSGQVEIDTPKNSQYGTNLGLYCPESKLVLENQLDENARFELVKRGGWITTASAQSIEKNSVYMFTEGSVFYEQNQVVGIGAINLTPNYPIDHKIYRCGKSIFLPVKIHS